MRRLAPILLGLLLVLPASAQVRVAAPTRGASASVVAPVAVGGVASVSLGVAPLAPLVGVVPGFLPASAPAPVAVPSVVAAPVAAVRPAAASTLAASRRAPVAVPVAASALRAAVSAALSAPSARVVAADGALARRGSEDVDPSAGRVLFDGELARDADASLAPSVRGAATPAPGPLSAFVESVDPERPTPDAPRAPDPEGRAYPWPKPSRWLVLGGLLTLLSWAPPLLHAATHAPFAPLHMGLGVFGSWTALLAVAVAGGVAGWPLRLFAHRLAPWTMKGENPTKGMEKRPLVRVMPQLAFAAAVEEIAFRGLIFPVLAGWAMAVLSPYAALAAGAFASAFLFALIHRYGPVWTRVVGALLYTTALVGSGTLLLPILMHLSFNTFLLMRERLARRPS